MNRRSLFPFLFLLLSIAFSACVAPRPLLPGPDDAAGSGPNRRLNVTHWINVTDVRWMRVDVTCACAYQLEETPTITAWFNKSEDFVFNYDLNAVNMTDPGGPASDRIYRLDGLRDSGIQEVVTEDEHRIQVRTHEFVKGRGGRPNATFNYLVASPTGQDVEIDFRIRTDRTDLRIDHVEGKELLWLTPRDFQEGSVNETLYEHRLDVTNSLWVNLFPEIDPRDAGYGVEPRYQIAGNGQWWNFTQSEFPLLYHSDQYSHDVVFPYAHLNRGNYTIRLAYPPVSAGTPRMFPYGIGFPMEP